ncbi:MAG: thioredoxin family protein [Beijerinckiaceae bacterium]
MTMMINRRTAFAFAAAAGAFAFSPAFAQTATKAKFSKDAFEKAQADGKSILVEISAPWCPVCKVQKPIISSMMAKPAYSKVAVFEVDFDSQKDALQLLKATSQSTIISFKGKTEMSRVVGETKPDAIEAVFKASV